MSIIIIRHSRIENDSTQPDLDQMARDHWVDRFHEVIRRWHSRFGWGQNYVQLTRRLQDKYGLNDNYDSVG